MTIKAPKIDTRTYEQIVKQTGLLVEHYTDKRPGQKDAGSALIRIFARFAELIIDRLNQVPEKNFLAFLDMIGTRISPPVPARVPLTFFPAEGSGKETAIRVPISTRVSAAPPEGDDEEVIFETEQELFLTTSKLSAVYMVNPDTCRYGGFSFQENAEGHIPFNAIAVDKCFEHSIYFARDDIYAVSASKQVSLTFTSPDALLLKKLPILWSWDGVAFKTLDQAAYSTPAENILKITFTDFPVPKKRAIAGKEAAWVQAKLARPLAVGEKTPEIEKVKTRLEISSAPIVMDLAFANAAPADLGKDLFPFGEYPGFNDCFYLASKAYFSMPGAKINLVIKLTNPKKPEPGDEEKPPIKPVNPSDDLQIAWETWNGRFWQELGRSMEENPQSRINTPDFFDGTRAFTRSGEVQFTLPDTVASLAVNGENGFWIRARMISGNYGKAAGYKPDKIKIFRQEIPVSKIMPATFGPPSIKSVFIKSITSQDVPVDFIISENNFEVRNHSREAREGKPLFLLESIEERRPTLYLGFDRSFQNQPVTLYAGIDPSSSGPNENHSSTMAAKLHWDYSDKSGWSGLRIEDETQSFLQSGLIKFIAPKDFERRQKFNEELFWLRAQWEQPEKYEIPRLKSLIPNTIWASQVSTVQNEILGSSNGEPEQIFQTIQSPVLGGPIIEIRELDMPSQDEFHSLKGEVGEKAITTLLDAAGRPEEIWVRYSEVTNFYGSRPRDRHYVFNHQTGEVIFGEGEHGMIPPRGNNNIRVSRYQTGGGKRGNLPAGAISRPGSTVPYVDAVTNFVEASGGADQESAEDLKRRGPKALRHRGRAVTFQDFKDLAFEASTDVARAWIIFPRRNKDRIGSVEIIIVPRGNESKPIPGPGLRDQVKQYILSRCSPTLDLNVSAANWVEIIVKATIVPVSVMAAGTLSGSVDRKLNQFLQPLHGGLDGRGWDIGCKPHVSDFYALLESVKGVDHVRSLSITENPRFDRLPREKLEKALIFSGVHEIDIVFETEGN